MSESIENTENVLDSQHNSYLYGGFQRVSSYDPNMCTTAARFSPFYEKSNVPKPNEPTAMTFKSLLSVKPPNDDEDGHGVSSSNSLNHPVDESKMVNPSYLTYSNEIPIDHHHQNTKRQVLVSSGTFNEQESNVSDVANGTEIDYIQQITQGNDGVVTGEPIAAGIVLHRSPNGHLYQNFYVTNENGSPEEIVELIPIDSGDVTDLGDAEEDNYGLQPYEFPSDCHMDALETQHPIDAVVEYEESQHQMITAQMLAREQQRTLLESTMSPLLAAVNDITQRDKELLSCFSQPSIKETHHGEESSKINEEIRDSSEEDDDYILVSDNPIESRARATLPTNYLYLGPVNADTNEPAVFAKKAIPQRTKFGPFEGEVRFTNDIFLNILRSQSPRHYPLLFVGKSRILIVTNENTSNWMRYVRFAQSFAEQNLQIIEEDDRIYFKCNRNIHPKEELRVGYHSAYAEKYNLSTLKPSEEDTQKKYELDNPWMCFECDQRFSTSQAMQMHLKVHDLEDASCIISKRKIKRKRTKFKKLSELPKNSSRCLICFKVFMTNASLKKHFALHLAANKTKTKSAKASERSLHRCQLCMKKFLSEDKLKSHHRTHLEDKAKPHKCPQCDQHCATATALAAHVRSHTNRLYSCVFCQETFKYVLDFKKHVFKHQVDGFFICVHCKKSYKEYHIVRRHIRIFHPAVKYPCNECDRLFNHMSFLRRHKATHAKQKPIQCLECEQQFQKKFELRQHVKSVHKEKTSTKVKKSKVAKGQITKENDGSQYLELTPKKERPINDTTKDKDSSPISEKYYQSQFKCEECRISFKRRGMLVNHLAKRHPEQNIESIEELNQPIVKLQTMFKCPHCPKLYKNNAKRKAHIMKNHPGMDVPPSFRKNPILIDPNVQTVGCIKTDVQKCHLCYKQYVSRIRLIAHYRKAHINERIPQIQRIESPPTPTPNANAQHLIEEPCMETVMDIYIPPVSPENKLLKLSSAALELSSIEDRKYFDFLNERSDHTTDLGVESSSNAELNVLPELFEESIACIE